MGFRYVQFGDVVLPELDAQDDLAPAGVRPQIVSIPGGWFAAAGSGRSSRTPALLRVRRLLIESTAAALRTKYNAIRALMDTRAKLWRAWGDGTREWAYARLMDLGPELGEHDVLRVPVELTFAIESRAWQGATVDVGGDEDDIDYDGLATVGAESDPIIADGNAIVLYNSGTAIVRDAIITLTAGAAAITGFVLNYGGLTMTFDGTVVAGTALEIDCGANTVRNDGVDAYDDFTRPSAAYWMEIPAGSSLTVAVELAGGGGDSTLLISYNEQWE